MRKLLILSILFFSLFGKSQTWCPPGAEWYFTGYSHYPPANGYFNLKNAGTVVQNSVTYTVIGSVFIGFDILSGPGIHTKPMGNYLTREFNNVVYLGLDTLYNFNANIGDKWLRVRPGYGITTYSNCDAPRREVTVLDTGSSLINGGKLKWLKLQYKYKWVETNPTMPIMTQTNVAFQKIGNITDFFEPSRCETYSLALISHPISFAGLRCYSDNNFALYSPPNYTDACTYINTTNINELSARDQVSIYPNPTNSKCYVNIRESQTLNLTVTDFLGRQIISTRLTKSINEIDLSGNPKGLYFMKFIDENSKTFTQKLIIE